MNFLPLRREKSDLSPSVSDKRALNTVKVCVCECVCVCVCVCVVTVVSEASTAENRSVCQMRLKNPETPQYTI